MRGAPADQTASSPAEQREVQLTPASWSAAAAQAAHAASAEPDSSVPLVHAWTLRAQDAQHDLGWLHLVQMLGFALSIADKSGRTLLHKAAEVRLSKPLLELCVGRCTPVCSLSLHCRPRQR